MADITMGDDEWIGFGASAGRLQFDSTPTPDVLHFENCRVGIGVTNPGSALQLAAGNQIRLESSGNGQVINVAAHNDDVDLLRVGATGFNTSGDYGFGLRYVGSRTGNNNSLSVFADQQTGSQVEALTIIQNGDVGIHNSSPLALLHLQEATTAKAIIENTGDAQTILEFDADRANANNDLTHMNFKWDGTTVGQIISQAGPDSTNKDDGRLIFNTTSGGTIFERMRINYNGNVGSGTTSPSVTLDVVQSAGSVPTLQPGTVGLFRNNASSGDTGRITLLGGSSGWSGIDFGDADDSDIGGIFYNHTSNYLTFKTNNNLNRIVIASDGNVGIGTGSPVSKLSVYDSANASLTVHGTSSGSGDQRKAWVNYRIDSSDLWQVGTDNGPTGASQNQFFVRHGNSDSNKFLVIQTNGNVGIGTTNPENRLDLVADSNEDGIRLIGSTTGPKSPGYLLYDSSTQRGALGLAEANDSWSTSAEEGDIVLRADTGNLHLQTGTGAASITLNSIGCRSFKTIIFQ